MANVGEEERDLTAEELLKQSLLRRTHQNRGILSREMWLSLYTPTGAQPPPRPGACEDLQQRQHRYEWAAEYYPQDAQLNSTLEVPNSFFIAVSEDEVIYAPLGNRLGLVF